MIFCKDSFVQSIDKAIIMQTILGSLKNGGILSNYEEILEDESSKTIPHEKAKMFSQVYVKYL